MTSRDFKNCLVAYNEAGNDYRFVLSREQIREIEFALDQKSLVDEIRELIKEERG